MALDAVRPAIRFVAHMRVIAVAEVEREGAQRKMGEKEGLRQRKGKSAESNSEDEAPKKASKVKYNGRANYSTIHLIIACIVSFLLAACAMYLLMHT